MPVRGAAMLLVYASLLSAALWSAAVAVDAGDASELSWCLGVLVAPQLALTTAQCAPRATVVLIMESSSGAEVAIQRKVTARNTLGGESPLSGFALVCLESPVDSSKVLLQFDIPETQANAPGPSEQLLGSALRASDQQQRPDGAEVLAVSNFSATIVPLRVCSGEHEIDDKNALATTQNSIVCILEQWNDVEECEKSSSSESSHSSIVARVVGDRKFVYGFVTSPPNSSRAACSPTGTRASLVHLVTADTSSLIQAAIAIPKPEANRGSLTEDVVSVIKSEDGSSSSIGARIDLQEPGSVYAPVVAIDLPPVNGILETGHNADASSGSTSTGGEPEEDDTETPAPVPAPAMESYLPSNYALLSSSPNSSVGAIAVAVLIAPRFLVANAEWFTTSKKLLQPAERVSLAFFSNGERVPAHRVWFESEFYGATSVNGAICSQSGLACSLVVIELERDAASTTAPFRIATSLPPQGIDMREIQLSVCDPAPLKSGRTFVFASFAVESSSVRKPGDGDSAPVPGLQRIDSTELISSSESIPPAPFRSAFATFGSDPVLLGLSVGSETQLQVGKHISQAFTHLATAHHRRFLDFVSDNTVAWSETVYSVDDSWSNVSSTAVSFFDGHDDKRAETLDCGGVAIAPKYILTTASCAVSSKISSISFGSGAASSKDERVRIENAYQVLPHPKYSSSQTASRYNVALLQLDSTVTLSRWIDLGDVAQDPGTRVARMELNGPTWHPEKAQDVKACAAGLQGIAGTASEEELSGLVCTKAQSSNKPSDGTLSPSSTSSLLFRRTVKGTLLVGLQLPTRVNTEKLKSKFKDPQANLYVSVFDAMRFIKAFAEGYSFGARATPPMFGAARPISPKQTAQAQPTTTLLTSQRYVVGLRASKDGHNFCAGSLVAPTFVLTAAHCVSEGFAKWVSVGSSASSGSDTESIKVLSVRVHPLYGSPTSYSFDAAILELEVAAYAPTVALDNSLDFDDSVVGTMLGYGAASSTSSTLSSSIRILSLPLWSRKSCAKVLPDVDDSFLCAGGRSEDGNADGDEDACTGDSGSPLVVSGSNGKAYLAGIVSSGYGCGISGVPGLYTRVFAIADFVNAYVVEPTWRYQSRESGRVGSFESGIDRRSPAPPATGTPASSPGGTDDGGSKSHFPKLVPRTGAAGSGFAGSVDNEARGAADSNPLPSQASATRTSNKTSVAAAVLAYESAISKATLRENLSPSVKNAVLQFFLGAYDHTVVSGALVDRLSDLNNQISLFSSGQLEGLVAAIDRHDALPLTQRKNRFGSMDRRRKETGADHPESCDGTS